MEELKYYKFHNYLAILNVNFSKIICILTKLFSTRNKGVPVGVF